MDDRRKRKTSDLGIPPRWLNCPRKGSVIAEKFIPFKTTLSDQYDEQVPEANRFTPAMLLSSLNSYKVQLGMWIDLTNTTRFYDKKDVESREITYVKLQCRGHGECPSVEQTKTFIQLSQKFISMCPLKVIGVHCTHGFNRTGFLIVAYLVESLSWSVEAAVDCFAKARPPGIYKADYLAELFSRYGDVADTPPAPPLPEWCNDSDDVDDDGISLANGESASCEFQEVPRKRRKEFVKKNPTFMEGVPGVTSVSSQPKLSQVQRKCQMMCEWKSSGFPGSQPVSMDVENLKLLHLKPYKVSWKADGTRYMMLIEEKDKIFFIDRDNAVFQVSGLWFPRRKQPDKHIFNTLLDGEMVIDKVNGDDVPRYLVYDIIKFEGIDVGKTDFERRLQCIQKEIVDPRVKAMTEGRLDRSKEPFGIRLKTFWDVTAAKSLLGEKFRKDLSHEIDGLIFQPVPDPYVCGRCQEVLKWKPSSLNSVDFKLIIKQDHGEGLLPIKKGFLYVGGLDQPFAEIKLTKVMKLLDKKIIECKYEQCQWKFLRERTDKSFPNSYSTAIGVCNSIRNPVTTEMLLYEIDNHRWLPPANHRDRPIIGQ